MTLSPLARLALATLITATTVLGDNPAPNNAWNLKFSDPSRGGRFLGIQYGDWVPITQAKALVEDVASRFTQQDTLAAPAALAKEDTADERADRGDVIYINTPPKQHRGYTQYRNGQIKNQRQPPSARRQDNPKSIRFPNQAPRNYQYQPKQNQKYDGNRRNRKLPPPKSQVNNIQQNQFRGKPVNPQSRPLPLATQTNFNENTRPAFGFVPSLNPLPSLNPFKFFEQSEPKRPATFTTPRAQQQLTYNPQEQSYLESLNAIQTIPAPDLSKYGPGPPIIELDSGADGEIILGRPYHVEDDHDHLASFVSLDFDGFTPGDRDDKKPKKQQEKEKLSILVGGKSKINPRDQSDLVNFLNNDKDNTEAFVFSSDKQAPKGFSKIDLPFMDPTKHKGLLPKAFIAPKGIPIPDGYKGKPLPQKPEYAQETTTERVLVVRTTSSSIVQRDEEKVNPISLFDRRPTPFLRNKAITKPKKTVTEKPSTTISSILSNSLRYKLQNKNRPSLTQFYLKNKKKAERLEDKYERPEKKSFYRKPDNIEKIYVNSKIEEARKEIKDAKKPTDSTVSPSTTYFLPTEHKKSSTFRLVNDSLGLASTTTSNLVDDKDDTTVAKTSPVAERDELEPTTFVDIFSAGDADNDPISIVYEPSYDYAQSTYEQAQTEQESTSFAPTVIVTSTEAITTTTTPKPTTTTTLEQTTTTTTTTSTTTTFTTTTTSTTTTTTPTTTTTTTTTTVEETTTQEKSTSSEAQSTLASTSTTTESVTRGSRTTQDPFVKLETLRKQKVKIVKAKVPSYQEDLLTADDIDEFDSGSTESPVFNFASPFRNRLRPRKYKGIGNQETDFGKRIRLKKRPGAFWAKRFGQGSLGSIGSIEPTVRPGLFKVRQRLSSTSTSTEADSTNGQEEVKIEDYKRKYRPFFEGIYSKLTKGGDASDSGRRYGIPRRRSTTAAPPITVGKDLDAEIYEVHPKTRLRITTRSPATKKQALETAVPTTANVLKESSTYDDGDYYTYQDDYLYEPTTSEAPEAKEEYTTTPYEEVSYITTFDEQNPPLEYQEYVPTPHLHKEYDPFGVKVDARSTEPSTVSTTQQSTSTTAQSTTITNEISSTPSDVHETADKHSTTTLDPTDIQTELPETDEQLNEYNDIENLVDVESEYKSGVKEIDLDIGNAIVDQVFEESQQIETTWNGVRGRPEEHTVSSGRLSSYEKSFDTSKYGADKDYKKEDLVPIVNEHGKQVTDEALKKSDDVEVDGYAGWQASVQPLRPYYEINRSEGNSPIVRIEELEITEPKDYSSSEPDIIYDITKESFDVETERDTYSIPISVAFNVPETTNAPTTTVFETTGSTTTVGTSTITLEESTTEQQTPSTTEQVFTTTTTSTTTERSSPSTTYSRFYSLIQRNRKNILSTTTKRPFAEVFLGTTTEPKKEDIVTQTTTAPAESTSEDVKTTAKAYESSGAHKIPTNLWSSFEKSRDDLPSETTTESAEYDEIEPVPEEIPSVTEEIDEELAVDLEPEENNTEGFNVASIMSYSTPDQNSNASAFPVEIVEIDDLPKPSEHESEVLVIEEYDESSEKVPKAFNFNLPNVNNENVQVQNFGVEQVIPLRKPDGKYKKKTETKTKKREEWIKNWVQRKFNKPKFPRAPLLPLAPASNVQFESTVQTTTVDPEEEPSIEQEIEHSEPNEPLHSLFAPTIPPKITVEISNQRSDFERNILGVVSTNKNFLEPTLQPSKNRLNVEYDGIVRDGPKSKSLFSENDLKSSLIEKYSSARHKVKNSLFHKADTFARVKDVSPKYNVGVPRGAKTDTFRNYGGGKLSQAEFERNILGVSTATEISVKSMICVKGRCFNADDMGKLLPQ